MDFILWVRVFTKIKETCGTFKSYDFTVLFVFNVYHMYQEEVIQTYRVTKNAGSVTISGPTLTSDQ